MTPPRRRAAPRSLAELARTTVSRSGAATLVVPGLGRIALGEDAVRLVEQGGTPTFTCPSGSSLVAAVGHIAHLSVEDEWARPATVSVVLTGRLALSDHRPAGAQDVVVRLAVASVVVEYDDAGLPGSVRRELDVDAYLGLRPDPLAATAHELARHLTRCHQDELRTYAATVADCSPDDVAGAALTDLDAWGVHLIWVDLDGGGRVELPFPREARGPEELSELLRRRLA